MSELGEYMTQSNEPTIGYKNAIIARFMGYKRVEVGYSGTEEETEWQRNNEEWMNKVGIINVGHYFVDVPNDEWIPCDDIHYHDSWDALMPVVEKIVKMVAMQNGITIPKNDYELPAFAISRRPIYTPIITIHNDVFQFITWYNQQTTTNEH